MSSQFQALKEMKRLTSPFPESTVVKDWKARGKRVIGYVGPGRAGRDESTRPRCSPCVSAGDNEPVPTDKIDAYLAPTVSTFARSVFQAALDGKWDFLDGVVTSVTNEGSAGCTTTGWPTSSAPTWMPSTSRSADRARRGNVPRRSRGLARPDIRVPRGQDRRPGPPEIHRGLQPRP